MGHFISGIYNLLIYMRFLGRLSRAFLCGACLSSYYGAQLVS